MKTPAPPWVLRFDIQRFRVVRYNSIATIRGLLPPHLEEPKWYFMMRIGEFGKKRKRFEWVVQLRILGCGVSCEVRCLELYVQDL